MYNRTEFKSPPLSQTALDFLQNFTLLPTNTVLSGILSSTEHLNVKRRGASLPGPPAGAVVLILDPGLVDDGGGPVDLLAAAGLLLQVSLGDDLLGTAGAGAAAAGAGGGGGGGKVERLLGQLYSRILAARTLDQLRLGRPVLGAQSLGHLAGVLQQFFGARRGAPEQRHVGRRPDRRRRVRAYAYAVGRRRCGQLNVVAG